MNHRFTIQIKDDPRPSPQTTPDGKNHTQTKGDIIGETSLKHLEVGWHCRCPWSICKHGNQHDGSLFFGQLTFTFIMELLVNQWSVRLLEEIWRTSQLRCLNHTYNFTSKETADPWFACHQGTAQVEVSWWSRFCQKTCQSWDVHCLAIFWDPWFPWFNPSFEKFICNLPANLTKIPWKSRNSALFWVDSRIFPAFSQVVSMWSWDPGYGTLPRHRAWSSTSAIRTTPSSKSSGCLFQALAICFWGPTKKRWDEKCGDCWIVCGFNPSWKICLQKWESSPK